MAKAEKNGSIIGIVLTLEEADTLRIILSLIGGNPDTTRRGYADKIMLALEGVGMKFKYIKQEDRDFTGDIIFKEVKNG